MIFNEKYFISIMISYIEGIFDIIHTENLKIISNISNIDQKFIIGVYSDKLISRILKTTTIIPEDERINTLRSFNFINTIIKIDENNILDMYYRLKFNKFYYFPKYFHNQKISDLSELGVDCIPLSNLNSITSEKLKRFKSWEFDNLGKFDLNIL